LARRLDRAQDGVMSEHVDKLRETLAELQAELDALESVDEETLRRLEHTVKGIRAAMERKKATAADHESLLEQLSKTARDFEESHPAIARLVGSIVDTLGQMGI
jgi:predicted transcriptional regulator